MSRKDITAGMRIRDEVFGANPYSQLSLIRQSLWALNILRKEDSSAEDKAKAEEILNMADQLNTKIEQILTEEYPDGF